MPAKKLVSDKYMIEDRPRVMPDESVLKHVHSSVLL